MEQGATTYRNPAHSGTIPGTAPRTARRAGQRGNAMLETALVFLPMFAMFMGIVDFGFLFFLQNSFQNAAREGVRFAVTYSSSYSGASCASSQFTCITQVVQNNSFGFLSGAKSSYIIVNYTPPTISRIPS